MLIMNYNILINRMESMIADTINHIVIADTEGRVYDIIHDWDIPQNNKMRIEKLFDFRQYDIDTLLLVYKREQCYKEYDECIYKSFDEFEADF